MSGMMGDGDANALFEVIERNKKRAEEEEVARNAAKSGEEEGRGKEVGEFEDHNGGDEGEGA